MSSIRITSCPEGSEPEFVRKAWINLEMSLTSPPPIIGQGFSKNIRGEITAPNAFPVSFQTAMHVLRKAKKDKALEWWKENHPEIYSCTNPNHGIIVFHGSCCKYSK
jgi:hypothetical protein